MHGKYVCTFSSNEIARLSFKKSQQTDIARKNCKNLPLPKATITWCYVPQTLKKMLQKLRGTHFVLLNFSSPETYLFKHIVSP